jgi:O-antigen/teichoic acid export membrane protein
MTEPDPPVPLVTALVGLAQVQLTEAWAEVRDQNTYALALAALGIAVIGIIAAAQAQLGGDWWVPIPGLGLSSIVALVGTRRVRPGLGINPARFYDDHGTAATKDALAQLLSDLMKTLTTEVPSVLRSQRRALLAVAGLFAITAVYSTLLLV